MMSMETHIGRLMSSHEEARRLMYLRPNVPVPQSSLSSPRDESLTVRRGPMDMGPSHLHHHHHHHHQQQQQHQLQQRIRCQTLSKRNDPVSGGPPSAVSRRNARERKRVRLVNLGFSTLRERVPPGAKNKKLSKVETLRAAIEYIRQLQGVLGIPDQDPGLMLDENYGPDDCSSVASSEDVSGLQGSSAPGTGSVELSPASSHPSDCSLVSSPYTSHHTQDDHLIDIGVWFS